MEYIRYLFEERVKKCWKCGEAKTYACFYNNGSNIDGKYGKCIDCTVKYNQQYYQNNKDSISEQNKQYYENTKNRISEKKKQYYANNENCLREYQKQYRENNKNTIREKKQQYRASKKDSIRETNKRYAKRHRAQISEYFRNRCHTDQIYKITKNIRTRTTQAIKHHHKSAHTLELLDCEIDKFIAYLKYQCEQDNLDINNNLHIDHIVPCSKFNLSNLEQQKLCFNWRNMRYCEANENLSKSDKMDEALIEKYKHMTHVFDLLYEVD